MNDRIEKCIQHKNYYQMRRALVEHNYCCLKTKELNQTFNYIILVIYLVAKPSLNIIIYIAQARSTPPFTRFAATNIFVVIMSAIFAVNILCVSVSHWAHRPQKLMYEMFGQKRIRISHKLKALGFIERLSGPDIGIYCHKLYPMNNFHFYNFICDWACNYFLVCELLLDMDLYL